jgi:hypothetical protein
MQDQPFELGRVTATAGAALALAGAKVQPEALLDRHSAGDFGDVDDATRCGGRVRSAYLLPTGEVVLAVTEGVCTTLLAPHERDFPWEGPS